MGKDWKFHRNFIGNFAKSNKLLNRFSLDLPFVGCGAKNHLAFGICRALPLG